MGTYYQDLDRAAFDYDLQTVAGIPGQSFRGPAFDPLRPYAACIGAAQTFGRFCVRPFPQLLAERFDFQFLNLGVGGAGPRLFNTPPYLSYLNGAEFVIVQVLSGRSEGNSLFDNRETGGLFGVRRSDNKRMRFEEFLAELARESPDLVVPTLGETQEAYVRNFLDLLERIQRPKVLLWFSNRTPGDEDLSPDSESLKGFPQFVDGGMVKRLRACCDAYVECVSTSGVPQPLWEASQPIDGGTLDKGRLFNWYYPSPEMHEEAANLLSPIVRELLPKRPAASAILPSVLSDRVPFVVLTTARTGSNLLSGLLSSHPQCFVGGELFNDYHPDHDFIPWHIDSRREEYRYVNFDKGLIELRDADPVRFIDRLFAITAGWGFRAVGFKLKYDDADWYPSVRDHLAEDRSVRIIHLKRRNLLRRLLSLRRAAISNVWSERPDSDRAPMPCISLPLMDCVMNFDEMEGKQAEYEERFRDHLVLEVTYEELAENPHAVGARATAFLGLAAPREHELEVRYKKTNVDELRQAITNYDELKSQFLRWKSQSHLLRIPGRNYAELESSIRRWAEFFDE